MNEKMKFIDPIDLPKPVNPELESYKQKVFENNPGSSEKIIELSTLLNEDNFDPTQFRSEIEDFNKNIESTKGHYGQYTTIETVHGHHGKLIVYHFPNPDSIKLGYTNLS